MANSAVQHRSKSDERLVLNAYKRLMRDLSGWCSKADRKQIRYAFEYANKAHISISGGNPASPTSRTP